jgi:hypothetical protein
MVEIKLDAGSFAVGSTITGRVIPEGQFKVSLVRFMELSADMIRSGNPKRLWDKTKTEATVDTEADGTFKIPLAPDLYFTSLGGTSAMQMVFVHYVKAEGAGSDPASTQVTLTPNMNPTPIKHIYTKRFFRNCCFADGSAKIEIGIPNIVLDRRAGVVPITVRVTENRSQFAAMSAAAALNYSMLMASGQVIFEGRVPAGQAEPQTIDQNTGLATLQLVIHANKGWQALKPGFNVPKVSAKLVVCINFTGQDSLEEREFDLSVF